LHIVCWITKNNVLKPKRAVYGLIGERKASDIYKSLAPAWKTPCIRSKTSSSNFKICRMPLGLTLPADN
jgi:hypothetical protein